MSEFLVFLQTGLQHVLDLNGYDHILFLAALCLPFRPGEWKPLLLLVSCFTFGHTLSLFLSVWDLVHLASGPVEFLIPLTIIATALQRIFTVDKALETSRIIYVLTVFFGLIHGFGFSNYLNGLLSGDAIDRNVPLLGFALGIELAQVAVVAALLTVAVLLRRILHREERDFNLVLSGVVLGACLPVLVQRTSELFNA